MEDAQQDGEVEMAEMAVVIVGGEVADIISGRMMAIATFVGDLDITWNIVRIDCLETRHLVQLILILAVGGIYHLGDRQPLFPARTHVSLSSLRTHTSNQRNSSLSLNSNSNSKFSRVVLQSGHLEE